MPECKKKHIINRNKRSYLIHHYYIAGVCISDPNNQGGLERFLRATYPYYHGLTYEGSKYMNSTIVPLYSVNQERPILNVY